MRCDPQDTHQLDILAKDRVEKAIKEAEKYWKTEVAFEWSQISEIFDCIDMWYNQIMFLKLDHADYGHAY